MYFLKNKGWHYFVITILALSVLFVISGCSRQATWRQTGGPEGENIYSLAIDPTNSQIVYAGTDGNGVFKTRMQIPRLSGRLDMDSSDTQQSVEHGDIQ